jgi:CDP-6-deoxy-D-xylo-4-hexulose-3-dehydrase
MGDIFRRLILAQIPAFYQFQHGAATFQPGASSIHYAGRVFDDKDIGNLVDASLDFFLTANRYAEQFESDFAEYLGVRCVAGQLWLVGESRCADRAHVAETG